MIETLSIETPTHGRVLVEGAADSVSAGLLLGFHGYGQRAEEMLDEMRRIPGASAWTLVAVQALHRFYTRGDRQVVASWMTREDRELAIADNVEYVGRVIERVGGRSVEIARNPDRDVAGDSHRATTDPTILIGFSQGASMAYRAAVLGAQPAMGVIAIGGDIPPELKTPDAAGRRWPPVLLATGRSDPWFTPERLADEAIFLEQHGVPHETCLFDGGHEWTSELRQAIGTWLEARHP